MRKSLYKIIFEADTWEGKLFDLLLMLSILISVLVVMLDSVHEIDVVWGEQLHHLEWFFTILFTVEYLLRLYCIDSPIRYATGFFGVVDLLAVMPTYLSLFIPGTQNLIVIRFLRILRIFRVLKFVQYMGEANLLVAALKESRQKITVFLFSISTLVVILGSFMYMIEHHPGTEFTSIPTSVYWAIVTMTTVGYGDISPETFLGRAMASLIMVIGYSIIAVPGGIVTAAMIKVKNKGLSSKVCDHCSTEGHDRDAKCCKYCGDKLS